MDAPAPLDPRLPGLALALDRSALLAELRARLPECRDGAGPFGLDVLDLRYRPGQSASLLLRIDLRPGEAPSERPLLFLLALPPGSSPPPLPAATASAHRERAREGPSRGPAHRFAEPVTHWPELGLHVHAFPADPGLPRLGELLDPAAPLAAWPRARTPREAREWRASPRLLSYTPRSRAALRFEMPCEDEQGGAREGRRLVGKVHRDRHPAALFAGHHAIWRATLGRVSIAAPIGFDASTGLSLQEHLGGRRLASLAGRASFLQGVLATARSLATVHAERLPLPVRRDAARECRAVSRWVRVLSRLLPDRAASLARHGARLQGALESRFRCRGTVHGDFHLGNVLHDGEGVSLLDWDMAAQGDPALDPGRFLGAMRVAATRVTGAPDGFAAAAGSFLDAYLQAAGEDERQVLLYESLAVLIASAGPFRRQRSSWREHAQLLVAESERLLERALAGPRLPVARARRRAQGGAWGRDAALARSLLQPLLEKRHGPGLVLHDCVLRHARRTAGSLRSCWSLRGSLGGEPWRARVDGIGGRGRSGAGLHRRLATAFAALDGASETLALPRPLGHLPAISLVAVEAPRGSPLVAALGTSRERELLERLGRHLANLARAPVALDRLRPYRGEAGALSRRLARLEANGFRLLRRLRDGLAASTALGLGRATSPTPLGARLGELVDLGSRIGLRGLRELETAPAGSLAAFLLAQLFERSRRGGASAEACDTLRAAFLAAAGSPPRELAAQEALALLRRAARRPAEPGAEGLVEEAEARLRAAR